MNTITQQNMVTESRLALRSLVYSDNRFIEIFKRNLKIIPTYQLDYDTKNYIATLTIDKTACAALSNTFEHNKSYYYPQIHSVLMTSLYAFTNIINQPSDELYANAQTILIILNKCLNNEICSFKLFDVTVILDNVINIYL